jgi:dolichol kinase
MTDPNALALRPFALELHALLRDLDPARWRAEMADGLRERIQRLRSTLAPLVVLVERARDRALDGAMAAIADGVVELDRILREAAASFVDQAAGTREEWLALGSRLRPAYDALARALVAEEIHVPALRPTNYRRNVLHITSGFVALAVIQTLPGPRWVMAVATTFFLYAWATEWSRRRWPAWNRRVMAFYGPVAHAHEWHRVNSATWYCTALFLLSLTGSALACSTAVLVLGVGDPVAAIIGRRWGSWKLLHGRSAQGSAAFTVSSGLVVLLMLLSLAPSLGLLASVGVAFGASAAGMLAELLSRRVDDNLTIPLVSGATAWALLALLS